ncbi:hypothetical protein [Nonomuraea sp. NPDC049141]|uniref:hypothetical protein n=1 Tax=Nonomuraea sp. NPDC049141 TaxID=3155500 RepID=UPI0033D84F7B
MTLAHFLDGLRCSTCGALNTLWLDTVRAFTTCRECRQTALNVTDVADERRTV